jgi:hypothetical protein
MDWLVLFGAQQLAGFAFGAVLENLSQSLGDLTKDAGEDIVKDFFKDSIKSGIGRFRKDTLAIAMGKAMAQFLYLVQQELEAAGIPHYQERCHPSQSQTRGLDGAEQCVVTARRSRLMSEGG